MMEEIFKIKRDMEWDGIEIKGIPYESFQEGSVRDSYMPYYVEEILVRFFSDVKHIFGRTGVKGIVDYAEIEKEYKTIED